MLERAINHMELANMELTTAMNLFSNDKEVMQKIADCKNQIRRVMAEIEAMEEDEVVE